MHKILGVWIDHKLNWKLHAEKLTTKLYGKIVLFKKSKNFLNKHSLRVLYQAQVMSLLKYEIGVWGNNLPRKDFKTLQKLQKKCFSILRNCTGLLKLKL